MPNLGVKLTDKKSSEELQQIISELNNISEDLDIKFKEIQNMFIINENFERQIKSYKIIFQEVSAIIADGKKQGKSDSNIIDNLSKIVLDIESQDKKVIARIQRSNALEKLHLTAEKLVKGLEVTIANCKVITTQCALDESLEENKVLEAENVEVKKEKVKLEKENIEVKKEIETLKLKDAYKDKQMQRQDTRIQEQDREIETLKQRLNTIEEIVMSQRQGFASEHNTNQSPYTGISNSSIDVSPILSDIEVINMPNEKCH